MLFSIVCFIASAIASLFHKRKHLEFGISTVLIALSIVSSTFLLVNGYTTSFFNLISVSAFSMLFMLLFSVAMMLVNALSYSNAKDYSSLSIMLSLSLTAAFVIATAMSLLSIILGLELLAIATTFMMLFEGRHRIEAAVKFFIMSSVSLAIFTFALSLLLPYSTQLALVPASQNPNIAGTFLIVISIIMFIAALGFDTAMFPFNFWIPDVYEGASTYVTSMLAGVNKKVAFVALVEILFLVFIAYKSTFSPALTILAILTMFFGNLVALAQKSVKRLFAYSSISQAGYILIGIATATQYGLEASIFYMVAHAFMIIGAFAIVMWLETKNIKTIEDYNALSSRNRFGAAALTIMMLSMAGIPPLIGFAGKFLLFSSAISSDMVLLAIVGLVNSFISIYYYARIINSMYSNKSEKAIKMDPYVALVVVIALAVIIGFGIYPQPLIAVAAKASNAIFSML